MFAFASLSGLEPTKWQKNSILPARGWGLQVPISASSS